MRIRRGLAADMKVTLGLVLVAAVCCSICLPAYSQTGKQEARPALEWDTAPSPESGAPAPLAPPHFDTPAPLAPGVLTVAPQASEPAVDAVASAQLTNVGLSSACAQTTRA